MILFPKVATLFEFISITNVPITIKNLQVIKLVPPIENPNYILADQTSNYEIYENTQAQKLLYIPEQTISIESDAALRKSPEDYPRTDRISYIKGFKNLKTDGNIEILKVKNNSLQGRVISQRGTFVNHAQAYYPGWKAYIDGKPVPIYLVNGLIQGVEVPPGTHIVDFVFDPSSLKIGAAISAVAILIASAMVFMEEYHTKKFGKEQQYQSTEHEEFD